MLTCIYRQSMTIILDNTEQVKCKECGKQCKASEMYMFHRFLYCFKCSIKRLKEERRF